ncbi:MAG TPA: A24 family peptidase [Noviherbaspirillum sp.]|nr:A24 family peptidase [Noviherbaspirillum sp.]
MQLLSMDQSAGSELAAAFELLAMAAGEPRLILLVTLLAFAAWSDVRSYRIPNWLSLGGTATALLFAFLLPATFGITLQQGLFGMVAALLVMLPLYALRAMGAGDAKLMAMVGTFLGPLETLYALLLTFALAGLYALLYAAARRSLSRMFVNVRDLAQTMLLDAAFGKLRPAPVALGQSVGRLPYAVCIGVATIASLIARQLGFL